MTYFKIHFLNESVIDAINHSNKLCPVPEKIQNVTVRLSMDLCALASYMVTTQWAALRKCFQVTLS